MGHKSIDYKLAAVRHYLKCKNLSETCRHFECSRTSLTRWVEQFNTINTLEIKNRPSISYKITKTQVKFALALVKRNPQFSMNLLLAKMKTKFPTLQITPHHLGKVIRDNNITRKRTKIRHYPDTIFRKPINLVKELTIFMELFQKLA